MIKRINECKAVYSSEVQQWAMKVNDIMRLKVQKILCRDGCVVCHEGQETDCRVVWEL